MKKLLVFSGLPGTGKSTLSYRYANKNNAIWLSVDPIEGAMKVSGVENNYQLGVAAYEVMYVIADSHLELGREVVIDAVNPVEESRQLWRKLAKKHDIQAIFIECQTKDTKAHKERVEKRVRNIQGMKEIDWQRVQVRKSEYQPWTEDRIVINTDGSIEKSFKELEDFLAG